MPGWPWHSLTFFSRSCSKQNCISWKLPFVSFCWVTNIRKQSCSSDLSLSLSFLPSRSSFWCSPLCSMWTQYEKLQRLKMFQLTKLSKYRKHADAFWHFTRLYKNKTEQIILRTSTGCGLKLIDFNIPNGSLWSCTAQLCLAILGAASRRWKEISNIPMLDSQPWQITTFNFYRVSSDDFGVLLRFSWRQLS